MIPAQLPCQRQGNRTKPSLPFTAQQDLVPGRRRKSGVCLTNMTSYLSRYGFLEVEKPKSNMSFVISEACGLKNATLATLLKRTDVFVSSKRKAHPVDDLKPSITKMGQLIPPQFSGKRRKSQVICKWNSSKLLFQGRFAPENAKSAAVLNTFVESQRLRPRLQPSFCGDLHFGFQRWQRSTDKWPIDVEWSESTDKTPPYTLLVVFEDLHTHLKKKTQHLVVYLVFFGGCKVPKIPNHPPQIHPLEVTRFSGDTSWWAVDTQGVRTCGSRS